MTIFFRTLAVNSVSDFLYSALPVVVTVAVVSITAHDHPNLHREVAAAVQSMKKGKSAGVDNIPAELVQAGGENVKFDQTVCQ